jgi:methylenetetrahydrofolate reductase (NADH)
MEDGRCIPEVVMSVTGNWTLEATLPTEEEAQTLGRILVPGTEVFLSMIPTAPVDRQIAAAAAIRQAGLEPVPHLAARKFFDEYAVADYLSEVQSRAGVKRLLMIGGDRNKPAGEFSSSLEILRSKIFQSASVDHIYLAGYPEGHPTIQDQCLDQALADKLSLLKDAKIPASIVSQFCFGATAIQVWVRRIREAHPDVPIKIGLAGPANILTLTKFAARCGVKASATDLGKRLKMVDRLLRRQSPAALLSDLTQMLSSSNIRENVTLHFFSFGGIVKTGRWAHRTMGRMPHRD